MIPTFAEHYASELQRAEKLQGEKETTTIKRRRPWRPLLCCAAVGTVLAAVSVGWFFAQGKIKPVGSQPETDAQWADFVLSQLKQEVADERAWNLPSIFTIGPFHAMIPVEVFS